MITIYKYIIYIIIYIILLYLIIKIIILFQFRLKQSGIENIMYIVENTDKNSRFSIPLTSLLQASVNCLIQDGFTVKYTKNHKNSMLYLSCITKNLIKIYKVCKKYCMIIYK